MEGAVHSHRDFRVRKSVVHRALNWLVTHNQYYRSNHVHIDVNALEQLPHDGNLSQLTSITVESASTELPATNTPATGPPVRDVMCCHRRSRDILGIPGYSGSSQVVPPYISLTYHLTDRVSRILGIPGYSGSSRVVPPYIPLTYHLTDTVSGILSIPGYSGSSRVVPPYRPPHRHSVRNTKYPGILGILPSCPPIQTPSQTQCPEY